MPAACFLGAALCAGAAPGRAQPVRPAATVVARQVDSLVADFQRTGGTPGVSVAVIRAGRDTLAYRGYGLADVENDVPATPLTVYRIGSVTKQFTAAAVLQLAEQGRLSLDASLGALLPQVPAAWRAVTVRQLLNHTSGIRDYTETGLRWERARRADMVPDSILSIVRDDTLDFAPGSRWKYDNTGFVLLGMLVEKSAGQPYAEYLRVHLWQPLGLASTSYCSDALVIKHRARGYERERGTLVNAGSISMTLPFAAGALCSTVGDLAAWNRALATGRVVGATSWARMTTPEGAAVAARYGYGIGVDTVGGRRVLSHGGGIYGFLTANGYVPDDSLSVTVLTNATTAAPGRLQRQIMRVALGLPAGPKVVALTAAERARYVGTYDVRMPNGTRTLVRVLLEGDALMMQAGGPRASVLLPFGAHVFGSAADETLRVTFAVDGERATSIDASTGGMRFGGPRQP